jgi:vitamin B12 transporter
LLLGIRYTNNSAFGNNVTYDINPSVKIGKNSLLYLSYSTGFLTPSLYELYAPNKFGDDPITSYTLGNESLKPETSSSFELGVKHSISDNLFFTLSWFQTIVNNHIDYVALWNPNKAIDSLEYGDNLGYRYVNLGQEITQGFELNIFLKLSNNVSVSGNISLLSSILKYGRNAIDTAQTHNAQVQIYDGGFFLSETSQNTGLLRRPGSLANFSITWKPVKKLTLNLQARYVGTSYDAEYNSSLGVNYYGGESFVTVADYTLLDASVSYEITQHFSATLRGANLLNTKYYEILGYTTMGRNGFLNLRYSF